MVLVEEVPEDILLQENEHESDFETDSEASSISPLDEKYALEELDDDDDFSPADETLYDRFVALKDMIPPQTRLAIESSLESTRSWSAWGLSSTLKVGWWFSTSALLVAMPLLLAVEDEAKIMSQEREMQMQAQGQQQVSLLVGGIEAGGHDWVRRVNPVWDR